MRNNRLHLGFWEDDLTGASVVPTGEWVHVAFAYDQPHRRTADRAEYPRPATHRRGGAAQRRRHVSYLPAPGRTVFHEVTDTDSFTYTVTDSGGLSATATAQLQLARQNAAPVSRGPLGLNVNLQELAQILATDAADDADGDELRITHVNGQPRPGCLMRSLPSSARVSLTTDPLNFQPQNNPDLPREPFGLRYDALSSFLFTLDQTTGSEAFTITVADAAGATVDVDFAGTWPLWGEFRLQYNDSRFDGGLGGQTARIVSDYRFNIDAVVAITDRQTGLRYGERRSLKGGVGSPAANHDNPTMSAAGWGTGLTLLRVGRSLRQAVGDWRGALPVIDKKMARLRRLVRDGALPERSSPNTPSQPPPSSDTGAVVTKNTCRR